MAPTRIRKCTTLVALTLAIVRLGFGVVIPLVPFGTASPGAAAMGIAFEAGLAWMAREAPTGRR